MKEKTKDLLAILWAYFGALTFGTIFMIGASKNITGNVLKIYNFTSKVWHPIYLIVLSFYFGLILWAVTRRKIL